MGIKDKLQSMAVVIALNGLAALAFVLLELTPWHDAGFVLAGIALAGVFWQVWSGDTSVAIVTQLLVVAALLAGYRPGGHWILPALVGALATIIVANQPALKLVVDRQVIKVAHLPSYRPDEGLLVPRRALYLISPAALTVLGVFAVAGWTAWPLLAILAVGAAAIGADALQALRARLHGSLRTKELHAALVKYDAAFVLYFSAPDRTEYHVEMWRPYLERIGRPWIVVTREPQPFEVLSRIGVPVLFCPMIEHVDEAVTPSVKAVFYVNNGMKNSHMVRLHHLTHIQLLHGDSDKASSFNPVTAMFDRIFVAGQAGIDRYAANGVLIPREKFDIVGRPQVEAIEVADAPISAVASPVVMYATTWVSHYEHANYSSLRIGEKIIEKLLERKATVMLRPHPYSDRDPGSARRVARLQQILIEDREKTGRQHIFGPAASAMTVHEASNRVDAMISDVSGIASDFLYSAKPFALTDMLGQDRADFEREFPLARAAYMIDKSGSNLDSVLDQLLGEDPLEATRREMKTHYLGDFPAAAYADGFVTAARRYL
ncbi:MAG TPA: CDP-glycerol glycerophosphotransferase [Micromonosporaceae bacterium]